MATYKVRYALLAPLVLLLVALAACGGARALQPHLSTVKP